MADIVPNSKTILPQLRRADGSNRPRGIRDRLAQALQQPGPLRRPAGDHRPGRGNRQTLRRRQAQKSSPKAAIPGWWQAACRSAGGNQIILSLARMRKIRDFDPIGDTITVDAGVTLQAVQEAAAEAGRKFPVSLGAEGTAQIGGVISTNAGGVQVLSYGSMRAQVLGLEVVLGRWPHLARPARACGRTIPAST